MVTFLMTQIALSLIFFFSRVHCQSSEVGQREGTDLQAAQVVRRSAGAHFGRRARPPGGVASLRLPQWRPLPSTNPTTHDRTYKKN